MKSIKVDFKTKNSTVEFDEAVISAQEVAKALADTPHMMGRDMQYGGSLVLKVAGLKDEATGKKAKDALSKVEGVSKVTTHPQQEAVSVEFGAKGKVKTKQLIEALDKAGLKGSQYGAASAARAANSHEGMAMGNHAGMRMNGNTAGMRMGGMRGHSMSCGCAMCMEMMDMDVAEGMEMGDMPAPASRGAYGRTAAPASGYYGGGRMSGGCGCCR